MVGIFQLFYDVQVRSEGKNRKTTVLNRGKTEKKLKNKRMIMG